MISKFIANTIIICLSILVWYLMSSVYLPTELICLVQLLVIVGEVGLVHQINKQILTMKYITKRSGYIIL